MGKQTKYSGWQLTALVLLRITVGWHFLYEGIAKLMQPNWTSLSYLLDSKGFMAGLFHSLGSHPGTVQWIDQINIWGLIAIGAGLVLGLFTRAAGIAGIVLLLFYYLSHPALPTVRYSMPSEGSYLYINKNIIEMCCLWVTVVFNTGQKAGLDRIVKKLFCSKREDKV